MKKQKFVEINGVDFELYKANDYIEWPANYAAGTKNNIFDVYGRPSKRKQSIWLAWADWCKKFDCMLYIAGHTCNFFTIDGFCTYNGKKYALQITYAHNRAYEMG